MAPALLAGLALVTQCGGSASGSGSETGANRGEPPHARETPPLAAAPNLPVLFEAPGTSEVRVERDVPYRGRRHPDHLLDVYSPPGAEGRVAGPAVVLVHGSLPANARAKDTRLYESWGRVLAASGLRAVILNWDYPERADVAKALGMVRGDAASLGIDPARICLFGFSAGVPDAFAVAFEATPPVKCAVSYYGDPNPALAALGPPRDEQPALLVAEGARDELVPPGAAREFASNTAAWGLDVTVLTHPSGVHAFEVRNDDAKTREIVAATVAFLQRQLSAGAAG